MALYRNYDENWFLNTATYGKHVSAMTGEKLDSKSDIAAELAWRDDQLVKANEQLQSVCKHNATQQPEITRLIVELAKANERVKELESQHQLLTKQIEPLLDMQEDGEYYTRCDMADDIYEAFIEGSSVDALNKFAIEKKQEAILTIKDKWIKKASEMPPQLECRSKGSSCYNWAMFYARELTDEAEQLRKEKE